MVGCRNAPLAFCCNAIPHSCPPTGDEPRLAETGTPCSHLTFFFGILCPRPCEHYLGFWRFCPGNKHRRGDERRLPTGSSRGSCQGPTGRKGDPAPRTDCLRFKVQFDRDHLLSPGLKVTYLLWRWRHHDFCQPQIPRNKNGNGQNAGVVYGLVVIVSAEALNERAEITSIIVQNRHHCGGFCPVQTLTSLPAWRLPHQTSLAYAVSWVSQSVLVLPPRLSWESSPAPCRKLIMVCLACSPTRSRSRIGIYYGTYSRPVLSDRYLLGAA